MIQRCGNGNHPDFAAYGGRGITVCERWRGPGGFEAFLADMGERPVGRTLDRFPDRDGGYAPTNCRWATPKEQVQNSNPKGYLVKHGTGHLIAALASALRDVP